MNKANIMRLAEHMEALTAEEYDQGQVFFTSTVRCGTPACVGGHAAALAGEWESARSKLEVAREWLGLEEGQANLLFDGQPPGAVEPTPQDAAATLRYLARSGVVFWQRAEQ